MAHAILVLDGGHHVAVEDEYEDVYLWYSHTASSHEVKQFQGLKDSHIGSKRIAVACNQIRAVIEGR